MLGRIMAGSNAVVAHDEKGDSLFAKLYPPDFHMNEFILGYCQEIVDYTGIELFIIDREINYGIFTFSEIRERLSKSDHFIRELLAGKKIFLVGSEDDFSKSLKDRACK